MRPGRRDVAGGSREGAPWLVVVCPTSRGGHIEHATAIALAAARQGASAQVLTRPGARAYLPAPVLDEVDVREVIPELPRSTGLRRALSMAARLVVEHVTIAWHVRRPRGRGVVLVEEPRYPVPRLLLGGRRGAVKLVVHNVVDHPRSDHGLAERLRRRTSQACVTADVERIVHGRAQRQELAGRGLSARHVPLPAPALLLAGEIGDPSGATGAPHVGEGFLCIGEIRPNKGVEIAVEAAVAGGHELLVVGRAVDEEYLGELVRRVVGTGVELRDEFVSAARFDALIRGSRAVLLPYTEFHAQSGVLSHVLEVGARSIVSDLPSLREQAGDDPTVTFVAPSDVSALADAMTHVAAAPPTARHVHGRAVDVDAAWREIVDAVLA